jgi:hypothetical protein
VLKVKKMNSMDKDEAELVRRLRSIEPQRAFDADAFSERVVVARSRRRNRQYVSAFSLIAATLVVGLLWQNSRHTVPVRIASESTQGGDASPEAQRDKDIRPDLAELKERGEHLDSLLKRIETAKMTMAALRTERHHYLLAVHRAELCKRIVVPDLSPFYRERVIPPIN